MQHTTLLYLVRAVLGPLALDTLLHLDPSVYRRLAHPPRKRKPQIRYPLRG